MTSESAEPHAEYRRRLEDRRRTVGQLSRLDERISTARGVVFLSAVALGFAAYAIEGIAAGWLAAPAAAFVALVLVHNRVAERLSRARRAVAHYEACLARLEDRWTGTGPAGERYVDPSHPYTGDLDVFGRGSLFQLLCRARTRLGEDTLADWLSRPAEIGTVRERQQAVDHLRHSLDLREELALLDPGADGDLDQKRLLRWSQEAVRLVSPAQRIAAAVLGLAAAAAVAGFFFFDTGLAPLLIVVIVQALQAQSFRRHAGQVAREVDRADFGLAILAQVLEILERQPETSATRIGRGGPAAPGADSADSERRRRASAPSRQIARLHALIEYLNNSRQNQFFAPIAFLLGLQVHLVHAIELWRARIGPHVPEWLEAVGRFEALCSLAGHAYERPLDLFPELVPEGPLIEGEALGHPLLPAKQCVRNDVALGGERRLLLISGSNMSGKSTYLRTVGTNAVLALAGAPVRARRLRLSPLQVASEMRILDSLQDGKSLFYAAVSRLKTIVDLAHRAFSQGEAPGSAAEPPGGEADRPHRGPVEPDRSGRGLPVLFLLDEILQGTNSRDRRIGAEGVIRRLVDDGAIGMVTTHDLVLTEVVDALGSRAANAHFEDQLVDGRMTFDYRLRPGAVEKSNALELMRLLGLDV